MLIFVMEYLSTEQEVRKVLGKEAVHKKKEIVAGLCFAFLVASVIFTYYVCKWMDVSFSDSWASSLGECAVAFLIVLLQINYIRQISVLIKEAQLDLVPIGTRFCANMSVIGFIFLVQCGDLGLQVLAEIVEESRKRTGKEASDSQTRSEAYVALAIAVQICLIVAYFSFFLLIFQSTKPGQDYEDLILHQKVPELVYLQTRKLLRDHHFKKAENRRKRAEEI